MSARVSMRVNVAAVKNSAVQAKDAGVTLIDELAAMDQPEAKALGLALEALIKSDGDAEGANIEVTVAKKRLKASLKHIDQIAFDREGGMGFRVTKLQDKLGWK